MINENEKLKLDVLRNKVGEHAAFKNKCKLKLLTERYSVEIIFSPKYDCELNPLVFPKSIHSQKYWWNVWKIGWVDRQNKRNVSETKY